MDPWKSIARLSQAELADLQNRKLRDFISCYVYPFSPHYRKLFDAHKIDPASIKTIADLKRIPFTSKQDFIDPDNPHKVKEFVLQPDKEKIRANWPLGKKLPLLLSGLLEGKEAVKDRLSWEFRPASITFTTGTTNAPVSFLYSNYDIQNLKISGARMLKLFAIKETDTIINMFPYAPHLAFWQVFFGGVASNVLCLNTGGGKVMGTTGNIAAIQKMKPALILGVPSYVYHVLRVAKEMNARIESVKSIVLGAARVTEPFKVRLAELMAELGSPDVSVFGTYGFTESRSAWAECPTANDVSSGYHLYPDKEIFEIIDPDSGEVKGEGEDGEIVYTSLDSRCSSVVRYRTGDYVRGGMTYEPCPHCGRTVARLRSDITRLSDIKGMDMAKIKGCLVDFNHFTAILSEFKEIEEWQIELTKRNNDPYEVDELIVYISARSGIDHDQLSRAVREKFLSITELAPNRIEFIPLDEMIKRLQLETANKEKRILDTRPKA